MSATSPAADPARPLSFRPSVAEAQALELLAARMGVPKSAVIRAGLRAVWAEPALVWTAPPIPGSLRPPVEQPVAPPPPPRSSRRRRGGKR